MEFSEMVSPEELAKAIRTEGKIRVGLDVLAQQVKSYWQSIAPINSGRYAGSIRIKKAKDKEGNSIRRVGTNHPAAHIIEYGSNDTPAFAVRAKVEGHFGD